MYDRSIHSVTSFRPTELLFRHLDNKDEIYTKNQYVAYLDDLKTRMTKLYDHVYNKTVETKNIDKKNANKVQPPPIHNLNAYASTLPRN